MMKWRRSSLSSDNWTDTLIESLEKDLEGLKKAYLKTPYKKQNLRYPSARGLLKLRVIQTHDLIEHLKKKKKLEEMKCVKL